MVDNAIYVDNDNATDLVEDYRSNTAGQESDVIEVSPPRGTMLRILNDVARGDSIGIPVYAKLRNSDGEHVPSTTKLEWRIEPATGNRDLTVSKRFESVNVYETTSLKDQRKSENVDNVKHVLTTPETQGGDPVPFHTINDVQTFKLTAVGPEAIDWGQSALYVDSKAIEGPFGGR